jgi:hypothetical protein
MWYLNRRPSTHRGSLLRLLGNDDSTTPPMVSRGDAYFGARGSVHPPATLEESVP